MQDTGCHIHFPDSNRGATNEKSNQVTFKFFCELLFVMEKKSFYCSGIWKMAQLQNTGPLVSIPYWIPWQNLVLFWVLFFKSFLLICMCWPCVALNSLVVSFGIVSFYCKERRVILNNNYYFNSACWNSLCKLWFLFLGYQVFNS